MLSIMVDIITPCHLDMTIIIFPHWRTVRLNWPSCWCGHTSPCMSLRVLIVNWHASIRSPIYWWYMAPPAAIYITHSRYKLPDLNTNCSLALKCTSWWYDWVHKSLIESVPKAFAPYVLLLLQQALPPIPQEDLRLPLCKGGQSRLNNAVIYPLLAICLSAFPCHWIGTNLVRGLSQCHLQRVTARSFRPWQNPTWLDCSKLNLTAARIIPELQSLSELDWAKQKQLSQVEQWK